MTFSRFVIIFNLIALSWAIYAGDQLGNRLYYFGEEKLITYLSSFQLVGLSVYSWFIYQRDSAEEKVSFWRCSGFPWLLFSLGFLFLAFDEVLKIHEQIDFSIHHWLAIKETAITDRLDDLIVFFYMITGFTVVYLYRSQLIHYRSALPYLLVGLGFASIMVILDAITNRHDIISHASTFIWLSVIEEMCKIAAESFFLLSIHQCWLTQHKKLND